MKILNFILKYKSALNLIGAILGIVYFIYIFIQINVKNDEIQRLKLSLAIVKTEFFDCNENLTKQNAAIKDLKLKKPFEPPDTSKIEKVFIKDKTCEGELKAYKELFNE